MDQPAPVRPPALAHPKVEQAGAAAGFPALQAPPLPISADKQQKLNDLLEKYRNDELTPEQYHQARKKILEQP
jgi:hypothetical protein